MPHSCRRTLHPFQSGEHGGAQEHRSVPRLCWRWRQAPCSHGLGGAASSSQSCAASSSLHRHHVARCPVALSPVIIASANETAANETRRTLPRRLHQHFASRALGWWFAAADSRDGSAAAAATRGGGAHPTRGQCRRQGSRLLLRAPAVMSALAAQHLMLWWSDFQPELLEWCLVRPLQVPPLPCRPWAPPGLHHPFFSNHNI